MRKKDTILIIDDDEHLSSLYRVKFEKEGFAVIYCRNGQEGFDALRNGLRPAAIVLDLIMPVMDGLTFLREASYKLHLPPVIVMTSEEEDVKKLDAVLHGAHLYLSKASVTPKGVVDEIRKILAS